MSDNERFQIYCKECEENVFLIEQEDEDTYRCPICNTIYTSESGVMDLVVARDYYAQYKGAVRAGLIPDPEWKEYDKEHPNEFK